MRIKAAVLALALSLFCIPALAQFSGHSEVSADFTGNFQKQASGSFLGGPTVTDSPSYAGGFLLNYRYHFSNWSALEVNYAQSQYTQYYSSGFQVQNKAHEVTLAYVNTLGFSPDARFRPFVEAGTGGLIFSPIDGSGTSVPGLSAQDRMVFLYGGGVDFNATHNFAVRLGYRGLVYKAPGFGVPPAETNGLTNMAEPYVGVVFHF